MNRKRETRLHQVNQFTPICNHIHFECFRGELRLFRGLVSVEDFVVLLDSFRSIKGNVQTFCGLFRRSFSIQLFKIFA